jgi:hypothetical protein
VGRTFDATWARIDSPMPRPGDGPEAAGEPPDGDAAPALGLECPACGCRHFETVETRPRPGMILRRKACRHCGHRVTTREKVLAGGYTGPRHPEPAGMLR